MSEVAVKLEVISELEKMAGGMLYSYIIENSTFLLSFP